MKTQTEINKVKLSELLSTWADYLLAYHPNEDPNKKKMISDIYEGSFLLNYDSYKKDIENENN